MISLSDKHTEIIENILYKHIPPTLKVTVYIFGSRVLGTHKPASDIDLGIACHNNEKLPFDVLLSLYDAFEESDLPLFVDIIDINNTSGAIKQEILKTGQQFWVR